MVPGGSIQASDFDVNRWLPVEYWAEAEFAYSSQREAQTFCPILGDEGINADLDEAVWNDQVYRKVSDKHTAHSYTHL